MKPSPEILAFLITVALCLTAILTAEPPTVEPWCPAVPCPECDEARCAALEQAECERFSGPGARSYRWCGP